MSFIYNDVIFFLFIFLRISGIFFFTPFFSSEAITRRLRLGFCFFTAVVVFPVVPKNMEVINNLSFASLMFTSIKEILLGMIIGFFMMLIFSSVQTAAQIYSTSMGFGMVNVFDPLTQFQIPILGQFKYLMLMEIFLIFGMHRHIIYVLTESFYKVNAGMINYNYANISQEMVKHFSYYFMISVKLALPILGILFLVDIVLGVMARIAPQMNVFFLGMPLKILVGFIFLISFVPYTVKFFNIMMEDGYRKMLDLVRIILLK